MGIFTNKKKIIWKIRHLYYLGKIFPLKLSKVISGKSFCLYKNLKPKIIENLVHNYRKSRISRMTIIREFIISTLSDLDWKYFWFQMNGKCAFEHVIMNIKTTLYWLCYHSFRSRNHPKPTHRDTLLYNI